RAPRGGISSSAPISSHSSVIVIPRLFRRLCDAKIGQRPEFMGMGTADALRPGVDLREGLRVAEARRQSRTASGILDDLLFHRVEADAVQPFMDAVEIMPLLAVELHEGSDVF